MNNFFAILLSLSIAGCSAMGPTRSPEFPGLVAAAVPANDGAVRFFGPGEWLPNVMGFTDLMSAAHVYGAYAQNGVCVITDKSLLFLQWHDSGRFIPIKRIATTDMLAVTVESYGNNKRLVVQKSDMSFDSFGFTGSLGMMIEPERAEEAAAVLQPLNDQP